MPIAFKLLASVILRKFYKTRKEQTRKKQAGFHAACG